MSDMTRHVRTTIRYDGPDLAGHEMDVQDLAPALLALADIIQIANRKFNGDNAGIRVLVNADVDQKCFQIDLSLVQSVLDSAKTFFDSDRVKTAREIAEWIGIIGGGVGASAGGIFALLKLLKGSEAGVQFNVTQGPGSTSVTVTGNGNTFVFPAETYQLVQDKAVVDRAKAVMRPLTKPGYESLSFLNGDDPVFTVSDDEVARIDASPSDDIGPLPTESVAIIQGTVRIKSPQYEGAAKWSLLWQGRAIDAEMAEEAAAWVEAFQSNKVDAPPNTVLNVSMAETVRLDDNGQALGKPTYVVSKIHGVTPPPQQIGLI
jgi:hypothetical protein